MESTLFTNWRKSSRSSGGANCVEFAVAADGTVGIRDSKDALGPVLTFRPAHWTAFLEVVRDASFDTETTE